MYKGKKIVVVMPAYNAAKTVTRTVDEVFQQDIVDEIILVDDRSRDNTVEVASSLLGVRVHVHEKNTGYGGNQKTCYRLALEAGADIVIMVHPDYQYTPLLIPAMASMIANGLASAFWAVIRCKAECPGWKYVANRFLTFAGKYFARRKTFGIPQPAIERSRRKFCRSSISRKIRTTLYSTTRCSRKSSGMDLPLAR
ncbi:MAG: glycosyltransferase family 2 protein [Limisphaerales bacterium]